MMYNYYVIDFTAIQQSLVDTSMNTLVKKTIGKQVFHSWSRYFSKMPQLNKTRHLQILVFKGSRTHLQRVPIFINCTSADRLRPLENTCKISDPNNIPLRVEKQKYNTKFSFIFFVFSGPPDPCSFSTQILLYCCEIHYMIVLHHDLLLWIRMSLFLFKIKNSVLQMWATTFNRETYLCKTHPNANSLFECHYELI